VDGRSIGNTAPVTDLPLPPPELAVYIYGGVDPDAAVEHYVANGAAIKSDIVRLLGDEWSFDGKRVLDFGCGSGRVLRRFVEESTSAELFGCDIDAESVKWVQQNLSPPLRVIQSDPEPPLPYDDDFFDAVWATAVLSHITDPWALWLLELHRILKPGGILIASVVGECCSERLADEPWIEDRVGMNVLGYGRPWPAGGPTVMHSEWWIRAHWGRLFDIEVFEPGGMMGQEAVVMRPREVTGLGVAELEAPEPNEPRELIAARHAVEQLHRENAVLNKAHDEYAEAYALEAQRNAELEKRTPKHLARKLLRR
jgi:SAM-dependent methyltransferase